MNKTTQWTKKIGPINFAQIYEKLFYAATSSDKQKLFQKCINGWQNVNKSTYMFIHRYGKH